MEISGTKPTPATWRLPILIVSLLVWAAYLTACAVPAIDMGLNSQSGAHGPTPGYVLLLGGPLDLLIRIAASFNLEPAVDRVGFFLNLIAMAVALSANLWLFLGWLLLLFRRMTGAACLGVVAFLAGLVWLSQTNEINLLLGYYFWLTSMAVLVLGALVLGLGSRLSPFRSPT